MRFFLMGRRPFAVIVAFFAEPGSGRARVSGLCLAVVVALLVLLAPRPAHANTFTVTSTLDPGNGVCDANCTLREAINVSNATAGPDTIAFTIPDDPNVPGLEVKTISPTSLLPAITSVVTIDGYTQPGAVENSSTTNANGAVLKIELSGAGAPANAFGLAVSGTSAAGTTIRGLVINRFGDDGLFVNAANTTVEGNFIGTNAAGDADLGNGDQGVTLLSSGNAVGGQQDEAQNIISGNGENGVKIVGASATDNTISNNHIGTDADAGEDLGNSKSGVLVEDSPDAIVGGSSVNGLHNIISGNDEHGVRIIGTGASGARVLGNLIGLNLNGNGFSTIGNGLDGVLVSSTSEVEIGGTASGQGNTISDNGQHGVEIAAFSATNNEVLGNRIGTNTNGSSAFGNGGTGVRIVSAVDTTVGGTSSGARNVISGNGQNGVFVSAGSTATSTVVEGNFIGTDANGTLDLGNATSGVRVEAPGSVIGGTATGAGNVISGNGSSGVLINGSSASGNAVQGNRIGTNANGTGSLGNVNGVFLAAPDNTVGGTVDAATNTISGNTRQGIFVGSGTFVTGNRILRNSIFDNGLLGIELGLTEDGPTPNDRKDPDVGPNGLQNFPVITSATMTRVQGKLNSRPRKRFKIQLFLSPAPDSPSGFGEGETFIRETSVRTNKRGSASFTVNLATAIPDGQVITATATDSGGNTSEFSAAREVQ